MDCLDSYIKKIRVSETSLDKALAIVILLSSIELEQLLMTTEAIKKMSDKELIWEDVCSRHIDVVKKLPNIDRDVNRMYHARIE